jgi:multiple sugar transport system ATP-binding protein
MNVFDAEAAEGDGAIRLRLAEDVALSYPLDAFDGAAREAVLRRGRVAVGVRPHAVRLAAEGAPARLTANQWLGDQTHLAAEFAGGALVTVEHERNRAAVGDTIRVAFAPEDLHFFDRESGAAIVHAGRAA